MHYCVTVGTEDKMSSFSFDLKQSQGVVAKEELLIKELASIEIDISSAKSGLNLGASTSRIKNRIAAAAASVNSERSSMKGMKRGLEAVNSCYQSTESRLSGMDINHSPISQNVLGALGGIMFPQLVVSAWATWEKDGKKNNLLTKWLQGKIDNSNSPYLDLFNFQAEDKNKHGKVSINLINKIHDSDLPNTNPLKKHADKWKEYNEDDKTFRKGYYDENGYHDVSDKKKASKEDAEKYKEISSLQKEATIASIGTSVSGAVWNKAGEGTYGIASGSCEASIGKVEADASGYVGLFSYTEDGKKKFTPGFGAEAGVGITAFSASAKGAIGNEYFDVHGNVSGSIGKAEAKGEVNVGLFDSNGKLNPQAKLKLSAEALLAEASGTIGTKIAGTDVDVKGSVNFGVGAHADIGFKDGKFSLDLGASLGVGVSVKLDIDFSGTVDMVADTVSNVWSGITGWFK